MSDFWHIITRAEATNKLYNPSFEVNITDSWTNLDAGAGAVFSRATTVTYYGIGAASIVAGNGTASIFSNTFTLEIGETVYAIVWTRTSVATKNRMVIRDTTSPADSATVIGTISGAPGEVLTASYTNATAGQLTMRIDLRNTAADSAAQTWFDGVAAFVDVDSTYVDGDQDGCEWTGEAHNSASTRSALSFDGGIDKVFSTDLSFYVDREIGLSAPPVRNTHQSYAQTPGSFFNGRKIGARTFTTSGLLNGSSLADLKDKMKVMIDDFDVRGGGEVRLEYKGGTTPKWFKAVYEAGLEGAYSAELPFDQRVALRFNADDPDMYQLNDTNDVLDVNDTATLRYMMRRKRSTGQWDDMGLTADPDTAGQILAILKAKDGKVYFGGAFTGFDGNAGWDMGVIYDPVADTFARWGAANQFSTNIHALAEGSDGTIYAGGAFLNCGDANGDYIVSYDPSAGTFTSLGVPTGGGSAITRVNALAFDSNGILYIGGIFTDWAQAGASAFDYIVSWNGAAYSAMGTPEGTITSVEGIVVDIDDNVYVCGAFSDMGGVAGMDNFSVWDGSAWGTNTDMALSSSALGMAIGIDGKTVYIGGAFLNAGNANGDKVALWTGTQFKNMGSGANNTVTELIIAPNGDVLVAGQFTSIGGRSINSFALWNGAVWTSPDIDIANNISALEVANVDPMTNDNYDTYVGTDGSASTEIAGSATVNNPGNADAFPTFIIKRSGGTSATLISIRNEKTGKQLYFNRVLLDGETVTMTLSKNGSTFTSDYRGNPGGLSTIIRPKNKGFLPNSDDGTFVLVPGDQIITAFVDIAGAPTMTANSLHKAVFTGYDD